MHTSSLRGGRHPWRGSSSSQSSQGPIKTPPAPPLGSLLQQLTPEQFQSDDQEEFKKMEITNVKFLASFNWIESEIPTIVFPGQPAVWDPPPGATKLKKDSGRYFRDPNAARYPSHPIEPAVKTVLAQVPDLKTDELDIFGCTSTMGSLLRFLKNHDKPFRFTVEAVGRTVFFVRRENAPDELIPGPRGFGPTGHGHTFPERYTRWQDGVEGSASHQRIMSHEFAGLKCLVRFEADGYLEGELGEEVKGDDPRKSHESHTRGALEISETAVRHGGRLIPQHAIFELHTRGSHKRDEDHLSDTLPRLWLAQIPFFILAFHQWGLFEPENITVKDVREDVERWENDNQELLRKLASLLKKLVSLARDPDFGKYEVCMRQQGILEIRKQGGVVSSPLASPLTWIWTEQDDSDSESDSSGVLVGAEDDKAVHSDGDDEDFPEDFTACSESCDYCGRCKYKLR